MKRALIIGFFIVSLTAANACPCYWCIDEKQPENARVLSIKINLKTDTVSGNQYYISAPRKYFNAVVFRFPAGSLKQASFALETGDVYADSTEEWFGRRFRYRDHAVSQDEHIENEGYDQSNLIYTGYDCRKLYLKQTGGKMAPGLEVEMILIWVPPFRDGLVREVLPRAACASPGVIQQSVWRKGLPAPKPGRNATPTEHCIVHHSAGGNGDTGYTDLVRAYYIQHTQVNGWDDIGYNYLVAANGDVYAGRDPEKAGIRQDNVQGAHFCGKNQLTMGVCMIGDFTNTVPAKAAVNSLITLLSWKVHFDSMGVMERLPHPTPQGALLDAIAGHRDGCATECPGNQLYAKLPSIRGSLLTCEVAKPATGPWYVFSESGRLKLRRMEAGSTVEVFDIRGARILNETVQGNEADLDVGSSGLLAVRVRAADGTLTTRRVLHSGQ